MFYNYPELQEGVFAQLRRGTLEKIDDSGSQQIIKRLRGLASERPEAVHRPQWHGFSSHPPAESEGLFLALGGRSDRILAMGFEHKDKRPKNLQEGGAVLYDAHGKRLKLEKDINEWDAGNKPVTIKNATAVNIEGATDIHIGVNGRWIRIRPGRIDLAIKNKGEQAPAKVITEDGPSEVLWARVD